MGGRDRLLSLCPVQELPVSLATTLILPEMNPLNSEHQMDKEEFLLMSEPKKSEQKNCFSWENHSIFRERERERENALFYKSDS